MTSAMACVLTNSAARANEAVTGSSPSTPTKFEIVVIPPANAAAEPLV